MGLSIEPYPLPLLKDLLYQRWGDDWLVGCPSPAFWRYLEEWSDRLAALDRGLAQRSQPILLIAEPDSLKCLVAILASVWQGHTLLLANPQWGQQEWQQVEALFPVDRSQTLGSGWGVYLGQSRPWSGTPELLIPTGGSSGRVKFARHTWATLMASVRGFQAHFAATVVNAYCVLPLFHVSGLMQGLRVLATGGKLALQPYASLKAGQRLDLPEERFLSLVPTQLQWLLAQEGPFISWLSGFRAVLLGGAPPWPSLLNQARALRLPLALTYGMTETASQVATLLPEEFLAGETSSGRALPHAQIHVLNDQGQEQPQGEMGTIAIAAQSLCRGYLQLPPQRASVSTLGQHLFMTDDLGCLDTRGYLHVLGRQSTKIITGGENVFPEDVEAALLATGQVQDGCVVGLPDPRWGQTVCALVVLPSTACTLEALSLRLKAQLAPYKQPKQWILLPTLPRTPQGKINRKQALNIAQAILG